MRSEKVIPADLPAAMGTMCSAVGRRFSEIDAAGGRVDFRSRATAAETISTR